MERLTTIVCEWLAHIWDDLQEYLIMRKIFVLVVLIFTHPNLYASMINDKDIIKQCVAIGKRLDQMALDEENQRCTDYELNTSHQIKVTSVYTEFEEYVKALNFAIHASEFITSAIYQKQPRCRNQNELIQLRNKIHKIMTYLSSKH